jgi:hypothetical protein
VQFGHCTYAIQDTDNNNMGFAQHFTVKPTVLILMQYFSIININTVLYYISTVLCTQYPYCTALYNNLLVLVLNSLGGAVTPR